MQHIVRRGETLSKIAATYGVKLADIVSANNIKNTEKIYVGQAIKIPDSNERTAELFKRCIEKLEQMPEYQELERMIYG